MDILTLILAIASMILLHELGHFLACRLLGIEVEEFGIGFPPRVAHLFTWQGVEYTLNALPLGGFVRPKGEGDPTIEGGLAAASPAKRFAVYFAGPLMNILTAILLYSISFARIGMPITNQVVIQTVAPESPAAQAGIQPGDLLRSIANQPVTDMNSVHELVAPHSGEVISMEIEREGQTYTFDVLVRANPPEGEGAIGIVMTYPYKPISVIQALPYGTMAVGAQAYTLFTLPIQVSRGVIAPEDARLVGYKGMYDMYKAVQQAEENPQAQRSGLNSISFFAMISASLGILNLLPIPAVDGGRILFLLPEVVLRRRIPPEMENVINGVSFIVLLLLLVYINLQDFINPAHFNFVP
ncbi:MAG: RIP metalloprotease [Anaerolineae bacterium]|nr:MAG: RIP metalloprotease [Anaerolineae bacterium]